MPPGVRKTQLAWSPLYSFSRQGAAPGAAAAASPGFLLEMQDSAPPQPTKSESVRDKLPGDYCACWYVRNVALQYMLFLLANHRFQGFWLYIA